jgi:hypothetical protein
MFLAATEVADLCDAGGGVPAVLVVPGGAGKGQVCERFRLAGLVAAGALVLPLVADDASADDARSEPSTALAGATNARPAKSSAFAAEGCTPDSAEL